jgi:hypothetical protein
MAVVSVLKAKLPPVVVRVMPMRAGAVTAENGVVIEIERSEQAVAESVFVFGWSFDTIEAFVGLAVGPASPLPDFVGAGRHHLGWDRSRPRALRRRAQVRAGPEEAPRPKGREPQAGSPPARIGFG